MADVTIYHNPRCSKSRATLAILEERKVDLEIVEYLKTPPDAKSLEVLLEKLDMEPHELLRKGESIYKELGLAKVEDRDRLIMVMVENPILIERPIVVRGESARIGRPPERVIEIL